MITIQKIEMMLDEMDNQLMEANKKGIPYTVEEEFPLKWLGRTKEDTLFYPPKKKYPNGYLPKIQYWQGKCSQYLNEGDVSNYYLALSKVKYFQRKNETL